VNANELEKAKALIAEALLLPIAERAQFLDETCSDPQIRLEIAALLRHRTDLESGSSGFSSSRAGVDQGDTPTIVDDEIEFREKPDSRSSVNSALGHSEPSTRSGIESNT